MRAIDTQGNAGSILVEGAQTMTLEATNGHRSNRPALGFHLSTTSPSDGVIEIAAAGELDLSTSELLREAVDVCCDRDGLRVLMVDLRDLSFIDSTGLRALWYSRERAQSAGCELVLRSPSDAVQHLLKITKLEKVFAVVDLPES
jgi:anti-anti-sigma factor